MGQGLQPLCPAYFCPPGRMAREYQVFRERTQMG